MKFFLLLAGLFATILPSPADEIPVWIGTGGPGARGIYRTTLETKSGRLTPCHLAAEIGSPGFLCISPDGKRIYSTCSLDRGSVAAFEISPDGATLNLMNTKPTGDGGAAQVSLDAKGEILFSAQYGGGSVAAFSILKDGRMGERTSLIEHQGSGPNESRQKGPHPHWTGVDPGNRFLCVPDLGADRIFIYQINHDDKTITPHGFGTAVPGGGPRHMKFSADARFAYVVNEMLLSVTVFRYDKTAGTLDAIQTVPTLPAELQEIPGKASEIRIHPSGKFVYAANRGNDSIAVFSVDQETGKLTFVEREAIRGSWPRNFNIDPTGSFLIAAGARSNTLAVFRIDQATGNLIFTGNIVNCPAPICVEFGK